MDFVVVDLIDCPSGYSRNAVVALMSPKQRKRKKEEYNIEQQN